MKSPKQFESWLKPAAYICFFISLIFAIFTARSLYDGGSFFFLKVLQAAGLTELTFSRCYANYICQFPMFIAIKLGVRNLSWLQIMFGIGCSISWPLIMVICARLVPRNFWLVVLACGAGYLNSAFVPAEHIVAHAFAWPICFIILFVRPLTPVTAGILLVSAFILLCSYEITLFLGPLLGALALWRGYAEEKVSWCRIVFLTASILLFLSAPIAVDGILHPGHNGKAVSVVSGFFNMLRSPGWTISWTLVWGILTAIGCYWPKFRARLGSPIGILVLCVCVLLWGAWPLLAPSQLDVYKQYDARIIELIVPMALMVVALLVKQFPQWFEERKRYLVNMGAALLLAQSLWHITATEQWRGYVNILRNLMASRAGIVYLMDTPYGHRPAVGWQATGFTWDLDLRNLCVEIGPQHVKSLVMANPVVSGTFTNKVILDQYEPTNLPDLSRYGIDYSEYSNAVVHQ